MIVKYKKYLSLITALGMGATAQTFAPTNMFRPYDSAAYLPYAKDMKFRIGSRIEYGDAKSGRNVNDQRRNIFALYEDTQSLIPAFMQPSTTVATNALSTLGAGLGNLSSGAYVGAFTADGQRGEITFSGGKYSELNSTIYGSYTLPYFAEGNLTLSLHVPVINKKVDGFTYSDNTLSRIAADFDVKGIITNLVANAKAIGGLDISNFDQTGIGDVLLMLDGRREFYQDKDLLESVLLSAKLGLSIPTGKQKNEDRPLSMALGNDGAWAMPIGFGLGLAFRHDIRAGFDVDFSVLFDKTRTRRLKTEVHQTEFLLFNKGDATKEYGLNWQFHLYLQAYHFAGGLSLKTAYQFVKHDDDKLTPKTNDFSASIVNTLGSLKEWTAHNMIFSLNYDCFCHHSHEHDNCDSSFVPQFNFFYKLAVGGKGVIDNDSIGGQFAISF